MKKIFIKQLFLLMFVGLTVASFGLAQHTNELERAIDLVKNQKYQEAIEVYQKYLRQPDKNEWRAYYGLGLTHYNLKKYPQALEFFQKSIALNPRSDELSNGFYEKTFYYLGNISFLNKDYKNAVIFYEKTIELKPDNDLAYNNLSAVFRELGQYEKAIANAKKALQLQPANEDYKKALAMMENAEQYDGFNKEGNQLFEAKDYKKAAKAFEKAVQLITSDEIFFSLGNAYYNSKQYSKAVTAYQQTINLNPNYPKANEYLADAEKAKQRESDNQKALWSGIVKATTEALSNSDNNQTTGESQNEQAPRLGKYHVLSYGAATSPPIRLGYFELLSGGKYNFYDNGGNFVGGGNYIFDAGSNTVEWSSGVFKDNGWGGEFTIEREGKTHKIRLKSNTIGSNSTDSN